MFVIAYVISWVIAGIGVAQGRPIWLITATAFAVPFGWYLTGTPTFRGPVPWLPPICFLLGALALRWHYRWLTMILMVPPVGFFYIFLSSIQNSLP